MRDIASTKFEVGAELGLWRFEDLRWPHLRVSFSAPARERARTSYGMRFECTGYPGPMIGTFWDIDSDQELPLDEWPVLLDDQAFRTTWVTPDNTKALYVACDRYTMSQKPGWEQDHRLEWWQSGSDVTLYLGVVSDRLYSSRYIGSSRSPGAA